MANQPYHEVPDGFPDQFLEEDPAELKDTELPVGAEEVVSTPVDTVGVAQTVGQDSNEPLNNDDFHEGEEPMKTSFQVEEIDWALEMEYHEQHLSSFPRESPEAADMPHEEEQSQKEEAPPSLMPPKTRKTASVDGRASLIQDAPKTAKEAPKKAKKPLGDSNAQEEKDDEEGEIVVEEGSGGWPESLLKAVTVERGQKTLVKTLYFKAEEAIEACDANLLRRALWSSSFVAIPEGRKFLVKALPKIGIEPSYFLMKKAIVAGASKTTCTHYGELVQLSWKAVSKGDENAAVRKAIEMDIVTGIAHDAIFLSDPIAGKIRSMLSVFGALGQKDRSSYDTMLFRCFRPVLWRGLKANNDQVRYRASCILLEFYPIVCDDEKEKDAILDKQHAAFSDMLVDNCFAIRQEAATQVLKIVSNFWPLLPVYSKKQWMTKIFDDLSRDTVVDVRIAVLHGLRHMLLVPACLNVTEHAMKTVIPRTMNDKNDRVRLESFDLLRRLKGNRYIRFFDITSIEATMARLEVEESESVRKEIVRLIFRSFYPPDADQNEKISRLAKLTGFGRLCCLNFHRLLYSTGMLTPEEAVDHLLFLSMAAYRFSRSGFDAAAGEMSKLSMLNDTVGTMTGDGEALSESDPRWARAKMVVESLVVFYMVIRDELDDAKHHGTKGKIEAVMIKVFRNMFKSFRNTSALGTAMMIGALLPQQQLAREGITTTVLNLLKANVEDAVIEPYLEATAHWDVTLIFKIIEDGLNVFDECHSAASPVQKKAKASQQLTPNERLGKALHFLKYLISSTGTSTLIVKQHQFELEGFYKQLATVRTIIEHRLDPDCNVSLRDEHIIDAFSMKQTLSVLILNGPKKPNEENLLLFVKELCVDADWFEHKICHCPEEEGNIDFWYSLCESMLQKLVKILMAWDFAAVPTVSKAPTFLRARPDNSADEDDEPLILDFISSTASILANFCSGNTPIELMPHVVNAAKQLHSVAPRTAATMIDILNYTPSWILKRIIAGDELDQKRVAEAYLNLLRSFIDHPAFGLDKHLRQVAETCVRYMSALISEEHVVGDPRMHDFEIPDLISTIFFKAIKKNTTLFKSFRMQLGALFCSSLLLQQEDGEKQSEVWMETLGACLQMAYLLDKDDPEGGGKGRNNQSERRRLSEETQRMVELLGGRIQQVEDAADEDEIDGFLLAQIKTLLP